MRPEGGEKVSRPLAGELKKSLFKATKYEEDVL